MTDAITCDECGKDALYRWYRIGDVIRYTDRCRSCRSSGGPYSDRQVAEDATEDDLRKHTGICLNCNRVFGSTWADAPSECNFCGEPLKRYDELTIEP